MLGAARIAVYLLIGIIILLQAFGLGDYRPSDTLAINKAWLSDILARSKGRPGQLTVHVYDLFGADPQLPVELQPTTATAGTACGDNRTEFNHYCARPPESWWPALERFHAGQM